MWEEVCWGHTPQHTSLHLLYSSPHIPSHTPTHFPTHLIPSSTFLPTLFHSPHIFPYLPSLHIPVTCSLRTSTTISRPVTGRGLGPSCQNFGPLVRYRLLCLVLYLIANDTVLKMCTATHMPSVHSSGSTQVKVAVIKVHSRTTGKEQDWNNLIIRAAL